MWKMKKYFKLIVFNLLILFVAVGCLKFPIDDDGLLITARAECYVSNFELLGADHQVVRRGAAVIDTVAGTIDVQVFFGTDLKNLYPQFTLAQDAKLEPRIEGLVDFSGPNNPRLYNVVSGNRQVRKTYTVNVTVQPKP
jgi:hypothetical protein